MALTVHMRETRGEDEEQHGVQQGAVMLVHDAVLGAEEATQNFEGSESLRGFKFTVSGKEGHAPESFTCAGAGSIVARQSLLSWTRSICTF